MFDPVLKKKIKKIIKIESKMLVELVYAVYRSAISNWI